MSLEKQLLLAAKTGNRNELISTIELLAGAGLNCTDDEEISPAGSTPLILAAKYGHADVVRELVRLEAVDLVRRDESGLNALHYAILNDDVEVTKIYCEEIEQREKQQQVDLLIDPINLSTEQDGGLEKNHPLILAMSHRNERVGVYLVEKQGANIDFVQAQEKSSSCSGSRTLLLHLAVETPQILAALLACRQFLKLLSFSSSSSSSSSGVGIDARSLSQEDGRTALQHAVILGITESVRALVNAGADKFLRTLDRKGTGQTALELAKLRERNDIIEILDPIRPFRNMPESPHISDVFKLFPAGAVPLMELHDNWLRREGNQLPVAELELIAAFTSCLNACSFCGNAHTAIAQVFGIDPELISALVGDEDDEDDEKEKSDPLDSDQLPITEPMRALLKFIRELTLLRPRYPARLRALRLACTTSGISDQTLHEAISVCALFSMMNRLVEGHGVVGTPEALEATKKRHAEDRAAGGGEQEGGGENNIDRHTYVGFGKKIEVIPESYISRDHDRDNGLGIAPCSDNNRSSSSSSSNNNNNNSSSRSRRASTSGGGMQNKNEGTTTATSSSSSSTSKTVGAFSTVANLDADFSLSATKPKSVTADSAAEQEALENKRNKENMKILRESLVYEHFMRRELELRGTLVQEQLQSRIDLLAAQRSGLTTQVVDTHEKVHQEQEKFKKQQQQQQEKEQQSQPQQGIAGHRLDCLCEKCMNTQTEEEKQFKSESGGSAFASRDPEFEASANTKLLQRRQESARQQKQQQQQQPVGSFHLPADRKSHLHHQHEEEQEEHETKQEKAREQKEGRSASLDLLRNMFIIETFVRGESELRFALELKSLHLFLLFASQFRGEAPNGGFGLSASAGTSGRFIPQRPGSSSSSTSAYQRNNVRLVGSQLVSVATPSSSSQQQQQGQGQEQNHVGEFTPYTPRRPQEVLQMQQEQQEIEKYEKEHGGGSHRRHGGGGGDNSPSLEDLFKVDAIEENALRVQFEALDKNNSGLLSKEEFKDFYLGLEDFGLQTTELDFYRTWDQIVGKKKMEMSFKRFALWMLRRARM